MKKFIFSLLTLATLFGACQNNKPTTAEVAVPKVVEPTPKPTTDPNAVTSTTTCYELIENKKDVTAVELTIAGEGVSGYYAWEPYQKDGGRGFFTGKKTGDIITAIFTYMIEGSIQSEEIMFKLENGKLLKGRGMLSDPKNDGNMVIKDKSAVKWNTIFAPVEAAKVATPIKNAKEVYAMIQKQQTIEQSKK